ncbi:MAG: FAD-dependent oxidoreductase, partial [Candidatus Ornithospirochaeta sp.]
YIATLLVNITNTKIGVLISIPMIGVAIGAAANYIISLPASVFGRHGFNKVYSVDFPIMQILLMSNYIINSVALKVTGSLRGSYMLFDKSYSSVVSSTIFQLPTKEGKGVLVTPTVHSNLMIGPDNTFSPDKDDTSTTSEELDKIIRSAFRTTDKIPLRNVITSFSGLRAHEDGGDFVIGEAEDTEGFYNAAGIESPGLSSAIAIGEMVSELVAERLGLDKKDNPILKREAPPRPSEMTKEERNELIKKNPSYGKIVCRCEGISEGEIIDAITRPLGARTLDGVKRRVRAGMGRCQGGFCTPAVMSLIEKYGNIKAEDIRKNRKGSEIIIVEEENV